MVSIENEIKAQYSKVFVKKDFVNFKLVAEYYFEKSAKLKKSDINSSDTYKLLLRNIEKRLLIGIGTELLIKACYLKKGYIINKTQNKKLTKFSEIENKNLIDEKETFTMNQLIQNFNKIENFDDWKTIEKGLNIAKVFRNKEGHVVSLYHNYNLTNYEDIETSIISIYKKIFNRKLEFKISMESNVNGIFLVEK
jgi:hypothetical protein